MGDTRSAALRMAAALRVMIRGAEGSPRWTIRAQASAGYPNPPLGFQFLIGHWREDRGTGHEILPRLIGFSGNGASRAIGTRLRAITTSSPFSASAGSRD